MAMLESKCDFLLRLLKFLYIVKRECANVPELLPRVYVSERVFMLRQRGREEGGGPDPEYRPSVFLN